MEIYSADTISDHKYIKFFLSIKRYQWVEVADLQLPKTCNTVHTEAIETDIAIETGLYNDKDKAVPTQP